MCVAVFALYVCETKDVAATYSFMMTGSVFKMEAISDFAFAVFSWYQRFSGTVMYVCLYLVCTCPAVTS